jgi:anti-sigma factor RsiW
MERGDLTCLEFVELVTDYLENALSPAARTRFEEHLAACRVCPRYVEQLRTTARLLGRLSEADLPEPAREPLLRAFRTWKRC